jgi:hypothetical protein
VDQAELLRHLVAEIDVAYVAEWAPRIGVNETWEAILRHSGEA